MNSATRLLYYGIGIIFVIDILLYFQNKNKYMNTPTKHSIKFYMYHEAHTQREKKRQTSFRLYLKLKRQYYNRMRIAVSVKDYYPNESKHSLGQVSVKGEV